MEELSATEPYYYFGYMVRAKKASYECFKGNFVRVYVMWMNWNFNLIHSQEFKWQINIGSGAEQAWCHWRKQWGQSSLMYICIPGPYCLNDIFCFGYLHSNTNCRQLPFYHLLNVGIKAAISCVTNRTTGHWLSDDYITVTS